MSFATGSEVIVGAVIGLAGAGAAIIVDSLLNLRLARLLPPGVLSRMRQLFAQEHFEQAIELCDAEDCFLTRTLGAGLAKSGTSYEAMATGIRDAAAQEILIFRHRLNWLALIAAVAPILGLLGTALSMLGSCEKVTGRPEAITFSDLAAWASMALAPILQGLLVGMVMLVAYLMFKRRLARITMESGAVLGELLDQFRPGQ